MYGACTLRQQHVHITVDRGHTDMCPPQRSRLLQEEWHDAGIAIGGLQESRAREAGKYRARHYDVIATAVVKGCGGVQLWLSRHDPILGGVRDAGGAALSRRIPAAVALATRSRRVPPFCPPSLLVTCVPLRVRRRRLPGRPPPSQPATRSPFRPSGAPAPFCRTSAFAGLWSAYAFSLWLGS